MFVFMPAFSGIYSFISLLRKIAELVYQNEKLFTPCRPRVRSEVDVSGTSGKKRMQLLKRMEKIADGRVNDAVKLAFLDSGLDREQLEEIDRLDLGALAEFKRSSNGTVEIKLVDRMGALEKLAALTQDGECEKAEEFFRALERKAGDESANGI